MPIPIPPIATEGSKQLPTTFYRKVIRTTNGRLLNLTPAIPKEWQYVQIRIDAQMDDRLFLTVKRLVGANNHAQATAINQPDKQDTSKIR